MIIYEGDNDLVSKEPKKVIKQAEWLIDRIQQDLPDTKLLLITPKSSVKRWTIKEKYEKYKKRLKKLAQKKNCVLIDVWKIMLAKDGGVRYDLFSSDNLHLNDKGYALWQQKIASYLDIESQ